MKTFSKLFAVIAIATLLGVCDSDRDGPNKDGSKTTEIERLWRDFPSYPDFSETDSYRSSRGHNVRISRQYKSAASAPDVQSFYMREAIARGWILNSQKNLSDWGRDLGGFELEFRKNDYTLDITYAGDKADYGWNYAIGIEWHDK